MPSTKSPYPLKDRSIIQFLIDLRLNYAVVSSGLVLFGLFWNNLKGFDLPYIALIASVFFANAFGFILNDFYDATFDSRDTIKNNRNVFCSANSNRLGRVVLLTSLGLSLLFGGIVSLHTFIIVALLNLLAFIYSAPPIRLRNRLYWDWIFVLLWKGIIILSGYFYFSKAVLSRDLFMLGTVVIVLLASLIGQLVNQIRDFEVDKMTDTYNSVQSFGLQISLSAKRVLLSLFYTFSFIFCTIFNLHCTMILILFNVSLYYFINASKHDTIIEFANVWIIALFLEQFTTYFSYHQQLLFSLWIVVLIGIVIWYMKQIKLAS